MNPATKTIRALINDHLTADEHKWLWNYVYIPQFTPTEDAQEQNRVTRAEIAHALALVLFADLIRRVPESARYIERVQQTKGLMIFDHGALRTVDWPSGSLPKGEASFTRFLTALGYKVAGLYPLTRLKMTGRSYAHEDFPEDIPQYFVSELHPDRFSPEFQEAVTSVVGESVDPLTPDDIALIEQLRRDRHLPFADAQRLIGRLARCFDRQHKPASIEDYELLKKESPEMAWISTEGNAFNHATDRVPNVIQLADELRTEGYSIKDHVEISKTGRVRQTAIKAAQVEREFIQSGSTIIRTVPGSFFEFISRDPIENNESGISILDLAFDAGNATGIFKMTDASTPSM